VAVEAGEPADTVAEQFMVGRSSVYRWIAAARDEGRRAPKRLGGGPKPIIRDETEAALRRLLEADNHLSLAECRDRLAEETGVRVDPWTIGRALRRLDWTWKKRSLSAAEQDRADVAQARANWQIDETTGIGGIALERLVFIDESAVLTNMARRYGRSPRGQRALAKVPFGNWKRLSVLGAISLDGMVAAMSVDAATDSAVFTAYLDEVLLPKLRQDKPDAVLVMDNLRAHKTPEVQTVLDRSGFAYRYLPSYSPDLSPIEPGWAKMKSYLRRIAARTVKALEHALGPALNSITAQDAAGFFRHCGYLCPN
jgi:transposase